MIRCSWTTGPSAAVGLQQGVPLVAIEAFDLGTSVTAPTFDASVPFANPYPAQWPTMVHCGLLRYRSFSAPGVAVGVSGVTQVSTYASVSGTEFTWSLTSHPPANVRIADQPAITGGAIAFDGVRPIAIAWDAQPGVGHYQVEVYSALAGLVADVHTSQTSLDLPAAIFTQNDLYHFRIGAVETATDFAGGTLVDTKLPVSVSRLASGIFRMSVACGNGAMDPGEECDPGAAGSTATCDEDCTMATCGDGFPNTTAGEECDEGVLGGYGCDRDCTRAVCGDGTKNPASGESCDDGNTANGDNCSSTCTALRCGNGMAEPGEQCDDGNNSGGDGCTSYCQIGTAP